MTKLGLKKFYCHDMAEFILTLAFKKYKAYQPMGLGTLIWKTEQDFAEIQKTGEFQGINDEPVAMRRNILELSKSLKENIKLPTKRYAYKVLEDGTKKYGRVDFGLQGAMIQLTCSKLNMISGKMPHPDYQFGITTKFQIQDKVWWLNDTLNVGTKLPQSAPLAFQNQIEAANKNQAPPLMLSDVLQIEGYDVDVPEMEVTKVEEQAGGNILFKCEKAWKPWKETREILAEQCDVEINSYAVREAQ